MSQLTDQLNWRYATKRMTGEKIPEQKLEIILEAIRLSASSAGLQPYAVFVISNAELKKEIHQKACPQAPVLESSHLLVFAHKTNVLPGYIDETMAMVAAERNIPLTALEGFANNVKAFYGSITEPEQANASARQTYIALGTALIAAASEAIDANPMEGFNPAALNEILGLKEKGLQSVVLLALGYRNAEADFLATAKKVRKPKEELFITLS